MTRSATAPTTPSASPAKDLRCKVIGEGANLGVTQRGRIEAALRGGRLNTDAIDNSAGVNTSDIEVNIKIALSIPVRDGRLAMDARNALLAGMTDEVAALVLRNNYLQTLALSLAERRGMEDFGFLQRLIQMLEARGLLDRACRISRRRHRACRTPAALAAVHAAGTVGPARLRQDHALRGFAGIGRAGRRLSRPRTRPLFPGRNPRAFSRRAWQSIGCAARSSPPSLPTR